MANVRDNTALADRDVRFEGLYRKDTAVAAVAVAAVAVVAAAAAIGGLSCFQVQET